MHHKIRCALKALVLAVACQALFWPRKPLLAADKPKPDPVRNERLKAVEGFGAVR